MKHLKFHVIFIFVIALLIMIPETAFCHRAWIGGVSDDAPLYLYDDAEDSEAGWFWTGEEQKLTLNSSYDDHIFIESDYSGEFINLEISGDVTISNGHYGSPIKVDGSLNICGNGTLTLVQTELAKSYSIPTLHVTNDLMFSGVKVIVSGDGELNNTIFSERGSITLSGDSEVNSVANGIMGYAVYAEVDLKLQDNSQLVAKGFGKNGGGVVAQNGNVTISDDSKLEAKANGAGFAANIPVGNIIINSKKM